eukprot:11242446-Karenia_brevis.AAC.1
MYGAPSVQPTRLLRSDADSCGLDLLCCDHSHRHVALAGFNKFGGFKKTAAARYPQKLSAAIAQCAIAALESGLAAGRNYPYSALN